MTCHISLSPIINTDKLYRCKTTLILSSLLALAVFTTQLDRMLRELICYQATKGIDDAIQLIQRFTPLEKIAAPCEVLGYATDLDPINEELFYKEFKILRYVIAPALLVMELNRPRLIGNFHATQNYTDILTNLKFILVQDFGNGLLLLEQNVEK